MPGPLTARRSAAASALVAAVAALALPATGRAQATPPAFPTCLRASGPETACAHSQQEPAGPVKGVMMIIAAGGWSSRPGLADGSDATIVETGRVYRDAGWRTILVEHSSATVGDKKLQGPRGFKDVATWFDALRARTTQELGANVPLCAFGQSSAGHFTLLLGVARANLSCMITEAAPTSLNGLPAGTRARELADAAFDPNDAVLRARYSPQSYDDSARYFGGRPILMGHLRDDDVVPLASQLTPFGNGLANLTKQVLEPGSGCASYSDITVTRQFAHLCSDDKTTAARQGGVVAANLAEWRGRQKAFVDGVAAAAAPATAPPASAPSTLPPAPAAVAPTLTRRSARGTGRGVTLRLACAGAAGQICRGTVVLRTASGTTAARRSVAIRVGRESVLHVPLRRAARRSLARHRRLKVRVTVAGAPGAVTVVNATRRLTLRAARS